MPTRLRKPSLAKRLAITGALLAVQVYLFYSALGGNFGIDGQALMQQRLIELNAEETEIDAGIARFRERISLLDPNRLDPDLLTERARALLEMTNPADIIIPLGNN
ncbi:MAG: septum formation initiator family protein [Cucumibacter sp.]